MFTEIYYRNMDIGDLDGTTDAVIRAVGDLTGFLNTTLERLKGIVYDYTFSIEHLVVQFEPETKLTKGDRVLADAAFSTPDGQGRIGISDLDLARKRFQTLNVNFPDEFYLSLGDGPIRCRVVGRKARLRDIRPIDVPEEKENAALTFLYDGARQVQEVASDDDTTGRKRTFKIQPNEQEEYIDTEGVPRGNRIRARVDTGVIRNEIKALNELAWRPLPHYAPLFKLLQPSSTASWVDFYPRDVGSFYVVKDLDYSGCNEQQEFIRKALSTPDFAVLIGPPGSGKTTTLLELVVQLVCQGKKVLMVASTHVAVDNVLERLDEPDDEGQRPLDRFGIMAVRVGNDGSVSEKTRKFSLQNIVQYEVGRIRDSLASLEDRGPAQEMMLKALNRHDDKALQSMMIESANFVCGTAIGFLNAPFLRGGNGQPSAIFDYMILDEASKTTFYEFLVPALWSKRWIISGDPRQLSPYIEDGMLKDNVATIMSNEFPEESRQLCLDVYRSLAPFRGRRGKPKQSVLVADEGSLENVKAQVEHIFDTLEFADQRPSLTVMTTSPITVQDRLKVYGSDVLVTTPEVFEVAQDYVPPCAASILPVPARSLTLARCRDLNVGEENDGHENDWNGQVAWCLRRQHELITLPEQARKLFYEILGLTPSYLGSTGEDMFWELMDLKRFAMPSIIDLLKNGYELCDEDPDPPCLYRGLDEDSFDSRSTLLSYQHRMHPEISQCPRALFYEGEALLDGKGMKSKRSWGFSDHAGYGQRSIWVHVSPLSSAIPKRGSKTQYNLAEVEEMMGHLQSFIEWADRNSSPESGGKWTLAMLTFYRGQEKKLSERLRSTFRSNRSRYFDLPGHNVKVEVCTVDRFQGQESDMVFLSTVRSRARDREGYGWTSTGFLDNPNRLNVAVTRAKYQLVIFGNQDFFRKGKGKEAEMARSLPFWKGYR